MFEKYDDIMSVNQLAEALGIGRNSAYALINSKKIYSRRIGRRILVPKSSVVEFMQPQKENNRQAAVGEEAQNDS